MELYFKTYLEEIDEPTQEEIAEDAIKVNASLKAPFNKIPQQIDPDDFYNENGVFSFMYSLEVYKPPGLVLAHWTKAHRYMLQDLSVSNPNGKIVTGRYGLYEKETPVVTVWSRGVGSLTKEVLNILWTRRLIHPESLFANGSDDISLVKDVIFSRVPDRFKSEAEQKVNIMGKEYSLRELPMFLHVLPASSQEHKNISNFICSNMAKYPVLKGLAYKVKCGQETSLYKPKMTLQQRQLFNTSESNNNSFQKRG